MIAAEIIPPAEPSPWEALPEGEYAIVELMGHQTFVGLIAEVERFGAKMICIRPLFKGTLLEEVYRGGSAIYGVTPCSREVAWKRMPKYEWSLPESVRAVLPPALLPAPEKPTPSDDEDVEDCIAAGHCGAPDECRATHDCGKPF